MGFLTSPATDETLGIISKGFLTGYTEEVDRQKEGAAAQARAEASAERTAVMMKLQEMKEEARWGQLLTKLDADRQMKRENNTVDTAQAANNATLKSLQTSLQKNREYLQKVENDPQYGSTAVAFWKGQVAKGEEEVVDFTNQLQSANAEYAQTGSARLLSPKYQTRDALTARTSLLTPEAESARLLTDDMAQAKLDLIKARISHLKTSDALAKKRAAGGRGNTGGRLLSSGVDYVAKGEELKYEVELATNSYNKLVKDPMWGPMIQAGEPEALKRRDELRERVDRANGNMGSHLASGIKLFKETKSSSVPPGVINDYQYMYDAYRTGNITPAMSYDPLAPTTATGAWLRKSKIIPDEPAAPPATPRFFRPR